MKRKMIALLGAGAVAVLAGGGLLAGEAFAADAPAPARQVQVQVQVSGHPAAGHDAHDTSHPAATASPSCVDGHGSAATRGQIDDATGTGHDGTATGHAASHGSAHESGHDGAEHDG